MKYNKLYYILILTLIFFVIGLIIWVNAILIPYFKITLKLTYFQSYLIAFFFHVSNFVMAIVPELLLNKLEYKSGIMAGIVTVNFNRSYTTNSSTFIPACIGFPNVLINV